MVNDYLVCKEHGRLNSLCSRCVHVIKDAQKKKIIEMINEEIEKARKSDAGPVVIGLKLIKSRIRFGI